jgi:hypothetical protein
MGALARGGETPLRREQLALYVAPIELPLGQHHGGAGDSLRARHRVDVFDRVRCLLQRAARLFDRALGVLRVLTRLELAQSVLKPRGLRSRSDVVGDPRSMRGPRPEKTERTEGKEADEPNQREAGAGRARPTMLIDT